MDDGAALHSTQPAFHAIARLVRDGIHACLDGMHIDRHRASDVDTIITGTARQMRRSSAGHQRLGWCTTSIDAGTAEELALDDSHAHAGSGQATGKRWAG